MKNSENGDHPCLQDPSLLGTVLGQAAEEVRDVSLALGLVDGSTRGDNLEGLLPGLSVHLLEHGTGTGTLGGTTLHGSDGQGHRVEVRHSHLLHGTLGCLLEGSLDTVELLLTLLDEECTTVRLENYATLGVHELGGSRHFVILSLIFYSNARPPFLTLLLLFLISYFNIERPV